MSRSVQCTSKLVIILIMPSRPKDNGAELTRTYWQPIRRVVAVACILYLLVGSFVKGVDQNFPPIFYWAIWCPDKIGTDKTENDKTVI